MEKFNDNITKIKGIGPKKSELLGSIGITTVGELLHYFPARYDFYKYYENISDINESGKAVFYLIYNGTAKRKYSKQTGYYVHWQCTAAQRTLSFTWFNQPYMINSLVKGKKYCVKCEIVCKGKLLTAVNPNFSAKESVSQSIMEPVYKVPSGISSRQLSELIKSALDYSCESDSDYIPDDIRRKYSLPSLLDALGSVHMPSCENDGINGMKRFIFEEFFIFRIRQLMSKKQLCSQNAGISFDEEIINRFIDCLPFEATNAQMLAVQDIIRDMKSDTPMNRIIQGDVGSGKTIVAFAACLMAKAGGMQSVIMVPTEVLARQHIESFQKLFGSSGTNINAELLVGSLSAKEKESIKEAFRLGKTDVLIGTQAILEDNVYSDNIGLVITDEQHRFGVRQRLTLKNKGKPVNMLVLTATPIPRTMSMIFYSDLDVSIINELPPGRIPVKTYFRKTSSRKSIYEFANKEISFGHQVYIICPLVDDDEDDSKTSVKNLYNSLVKNEFKNVRCAMLYGSMKPQEKEDVMNSFAEGKIDALISTTVIEVGINVPNATVMIIENAEKFGLAQLHQLRGRVGRGNEKSYCILISDSQNEIALSRLSMLTKTNNGFDIANEDLRLRGQGEYFGLRQHGQQQFKYGELPRDALIFAQAANAAEFTEANKHIYIDFYTFVCEKAKKLNDNVIFN